MIKVGFDLTALLPQATGVDNYLRNLLLHLGRLDSRNRYYVFVNSVDRHLFAGHLPRNFVITPICLRPRPVRLAFQQILLPAVTAILDLDVVHSPAFIMPLVRGRARHMLNVYDMTIFTSPDFHIPLRRSTPFRRAVSWSIRHAHLVCVPSRAVSKDIQRIIPEVSQEKIRVIVPGIEDIFRPKPKEEIKLVLRRLGICSSYILYVGTLEPRKNLLGLLESYRRLISQQDTAPNLVLTGRLGWAYQDLFAMLETPELRGRVQRVGYVEQADLPFLYAGAKLFVYPSWQEGFGFPPLEAMSCGVPTISSRSSSLVENLQGAAELVPPQDPASLTEAMTRLLCDEQLRESRIRKGLKRAARFRWEEAARAVLECYQELASNRHS